MKIGHATITEHFEVSLSSYNQLSLQVIVDIVDIIWVELYDTTASKTDAIKDRPSLSGPTQ